MQKGSIYRWKKVLQVSKYCSSAYSVEKVQNKTKAGTKSNPHIFTNM